MDKEHVIELIRCAKINTNNIRTVGFVMIEAVQLQLDEALKALKEDEEEE